MSRKHNFTRERKTSSTWSKLSKIWRTLITNNWSRLVGFYLTRYALERRIQRAQKHFMILSQRRWSMKYQQFVLHESYFWKFSPWKSFFKTKNMYLISNLPTWKVISRISNSLLKTFGSVTRNAAPCLELEFGFRCSNFLFKIPHPIIPQRKNKRKIRSLEKLPKWISTGDFDDIAAEFSSLATFLRSSEK